MVVEEGTLSLVQDPVVQAVVVLLLLAVIWPHWQKAKPQYGSADYWDDRYRRRWESYEWYVGHSDLESAGFLTRAVLSTDGLRILDVGCGNSNLANEMFEASGRRARITGIDFAESAIEAMTSTARSPAHRDMYRWMDARAMEFGGSTFDIVVDKGTLDGLVGDCAASSLHDARRVVNEVARVLKPGSTYITISVTDWASKEWPSKLGLSKHFRHFDGKRISAQAQGGGEVKTIAVFCHEWTKLTNREKDKQIRETQREQRKQRHKVESSNDSSICSGKKRH